jgi:uncharacterized OB-fold protein
MPSSKPTPKRTELTAPFWDAAREHRLVIQRCTACGYYNHPPVPLCDDCSSPDLAFTEVSGKGTVYTYSLMHQKNIQGFEEDIPYMTALVELDEQPNLLLMTNLPGAKPDEIKIGQPVEVEFQQFTDDIVLPQFRLANGA